jgi:hypothetical protein
VQVKRGVKTCASGSTNGKGWAIARDGKNEASRDEGGVQAKYMAIKPRRQRNEARKVEEKATKKRVAHEVDRIMEEENQNGET